MGNRAIIKFVEEDNSGDDGAYIYEHWFNDKSFRRKLKKAIRRGYRLDFLAAAYVAVSAEEDLASFKRTAKRHNRPLAKFDVTTVRIMSNPEPWYDGLDVPSPIVVSTKLYDFARVTYPSGESFRIPWAQSREMKSLEPKV
jgi:hypothetical protein